ncbi:phospholipase A and acyltransferase 3-like [Ruditapes philippinarum]|uniref:phospholipase A and acyltransferase 3-like n=1 Tax=Ruditapes philippinarum TaxID=129788 RepID=UPI00295ABFE7|nr:phospholipase A and acyltransferase 3-like [Ruditapes philippinarum]
MGANSIKEHNTNVLKSLKKGDLVEVKRSVLYSHWAVYAGEEMVIHLTGDDNSGSSAFSTPGSVFTICGKTFDKARVKLEEFWEVVDGCKCVKNNSKDKKLSPHKAQEIVQKGLEMLGNIDYNVLWSNCEHFASFCRYGKYKSDQADFAILSGILTLVSSVLSFAASVGVVLVRRQNR